jgi:hypothetical protein
MKKTFLAFVLCAAFLFPACSAQTAPKAAEKAALTALKSDIDEAFLAAIRNILVEGKQIPADNMTLPALFKQTSFPQEAYGFVSVLYEPGAKSYKAISTKRSSYEDIRYSLNALMDNAKFREFHPADKNKCRIQIDFILEKPQPADFQTFSQSSLKKDRFELGVDGLLGMHMDKTYYFLPGDAFVKSILYLDQLGAIMRKGFPGKPPLQAISFERFRTESYVSYEDRWIRLYRGYPEPQPLTKAQVETAAARGVDYLIRYQKSDGRFLYYYDAAKDSYVDHEHKDRDPEKNPYYNELRHAGGCLLLLHHYERTHDAAALEAVKKAIDWLVGITVDYKLPDGQDASYLYANKKSKLGGAGLSLYVLSEYQHLTGDKTYESKAQKIARHLAAQVTSTGEFLYYNIYLDKPVTPEENKKYFSFYYPGEAMAGLATYYKFVSQDKAEKALLLEKMKSAMHFLLEVRPKTHADQYTSLPSDSWLMVAVNEMWDIPELQDESYKHFAFKDANAMLDHMYNEKDALYPDYVGAFYYHYGDFPFPDGARCEGLVGAYKLAKKAGDKAEMQKIHEGIRKTMRATLLLCNTPESVYSVPNPEKAIGGIRFKTTRQWFRVDTIQHVAAYYVKFLDNFDDFS